MTRRLLRPAGMANAGSVAQQPPPSVVWHSASRSRGHPGGQKNRQERGRPVASENQGML